MFFDHNSYAIGTDCNSTNGCLFLQLVSDFHYAIIFSRFVPQLGAKSETIFETSINWSIPQNDFTVSSILQKNLCSLVRFLLETKNFSITKGL